MQLYALNQQGQITSALNAKKQVDYYCLECQQKIRLRGGSERQLHFYHLDPTPFCRQHQKGRIHIQLQSYFFQQLPTGDCQIELSFPLIRRIADVAWFSEKIVFEIQYSPISPQEVIERTRDYQSVGWEVIWILHDHRYNQYRLSAAEIALRTTPHFFTNFNEVGDGLIYDQFDYCDHAFRYNRLSPLPIDIKNVMRSLNFPKQHCIYKLAQRKGAWLLGFKGDLLDCFLKGENKEYFLEATAIEKKYYEKKTVTGLNILRKIFHLVWKKGIVFSYELLFRFLLERMCR